MKYYLQEIGEVFKNIKSTENGLSSAKAEKRLQENGKNKLKEGDLDRFSKEQIAEMQAACARRRANIESLYETINRLGL